MPIYQTAHYRVNAGAVDTVKKAIEEFVGYNGTRCYAAWQREDDPTSFLHLFIFEDEAAHEAHGSSDAVRRFESVYSPELVGGPVVFTDYRLAAANVHPGRLVSRCVAGHDPWQDNTFRFTLADLDDGRCRLRFWQEYAKELDDDAHGTYNFNWDYYLESLRLTCTTGTGKPFQPT
jgi:quinol monooxygenase YgiN